jgi:hypothetical protein
VDDQDYGEGAGGRRGQAAIVAARRWTRTAELENVVRKALMVIRDEERIPTRILPGDPHPLNAELDELRLVAAAECAFSPSGGLI